jgi:hypothetical protein
LSIFSYNGHRFLLYTKAGFIVKNSGYRTSDITGVIAMKENKLMAVKQRNSAKEQTKNIEKHIRYLQRELVRASFQGNEKVGLCRKILALIKSERLKISDLSLGQQQ